MTTNTFALCAIRLVKLNLGGSIRRRSKLIACQQPTSNASEGSLSRQSLANTGNNNMMFIARLFYSGQAKTLSNLFEVIICKSFN
jgi:hypothetical protein